MLKWLTSGWGVVAFVGCSFQKELVLIWSNKSPERFADKWPGS